MNRKLIFSLFTLLALVLSLAACASAAPTAASQAQPVTQNVPASDTAGGSPATPSTAAGHGTSPTAGQNLARTDSQGAVEFVVTPLNLTAAGASLDFDVSMNTHSVSVSWDLAAQSVLKTDTGLEVTGMSWPVGGGHHYDGTLTFPAMTADGKALLDGAQTLTLTIRDTDVPERVFVWSLSK